MMPQENVRLVERAIAAINARDIALDEGENAELLKSSNCHYESDRVATKTGMIRLVFIW